MTAPHWHITQVWNSAWYSPHGLLAVTQTPLYVQVFNIIANNPTPTITGVLSIIGFIVSQLRKRDTDTLQRQREAMTTWKDLAESRAEDLQRRAEEIVTITKERDDVVAKLADTVAILAKASLSKRRSEIIDDENDKNVSDTED